MARRYCRQAHRRRNRGCIAGLTASRPSGPADGVPRRRRPSRAASDCGSAAGSRVRRRHRRARRHLRRRVILRRRPVHRPSDQGAPRSPHRPLYRGRRHPGAAFIAGAGARGSRRPAASSARGPARSPSAGPHRARRGSSTPPASGPALRRPSWRWLLQSLAPPAARTAAQTPRPAMPFRLLPPRAGLSCCRRWSPLRNRPAPVPLAPTSPGPSPPAVPA